MSDVISEVVLTNLAFNKKMTNYLPQKVEISSVLDDRYMICIKVGDWETKIKKEDLRRVL